MRALLRSPDPPPPRGEFATQSSAAAEGGLDAASWKQKVADAKQALDERNPDVAAARYTELYQDLAKTAGANVIADIPDSFPVHRANADDTGFKPGLNLVLKPGGSTPRARSGCGWALRPAIPNRTSRSGSSAPPSPTTS
jgi:hypothetical protein